MVRTESVLHVDDDLIVTKPVVERLLKAHRAEPRRIIGLDGRGFDGKTGNYNPPGSKHWMALTRTFVHSTSYMKAYMGDKELVDFVDSDHNGEYIAMNFVIRNASGQWAKIVGGQGRKELPVHEGLHSKSNKWHLDVKDLKYESFAY